MPDLRMRHIAQGCVERRAADILFDTALPAAAAHTPALFQTDVPRTLFGKVRDFTAADPCAAHARTEREHGRAAFRAAGDVFAECGRLPVVQTFAYLSRFPRDKAAEVESRISRQQRRCEQHFAVRAYLPRARHRHAAVIRPAVERQPLAIGIGDPFRPAGNVGRNAAFIRKDAVGYKRAFQARAAEIERENAIFHL